MRSCFSLAHLVIRTTASTRPTIYTTTDLADIFTVFTWLCTIYYLFFGNNALYYALLLGTLADAVALYPQVWHKGNAPAVAIMNQLLDWDDHYRGLVRKISGFTNTKRDHAAVYAFLLKKSKGGFVELFWKESTMDSVPWKGVGGIAGAPGYVILSSRPRLPPVVLAPKHAGQLTPQAYMKDFNSAAYGEALKTQKHADDVPWLKEVASTGEIPIVRRVP
jgi:hypothetical protein